MKDLKSSEKSLKIIKANIDIAYIYANLSYAKRRKCGAVLVTPDNKRILMGGYNGTLPGFPNVCEVNDKTLEEVVHAEQNVITFCAKNGIKTDGCILYSTTLPCVNCAKLIISAGIKTVYFVEDYRDRRSLELFQKSGVSVYRIKLGELNERL